MNKHILLVMKWLNDKDSVSQEELEDNEAEAGAADAYAYDTTYAVDAAYAATAYAAANDAAAATRWVDKYFKRTGEDRNKYLKELEK